jgi:hypothetical protein
MTTIAIQYFIPNYKIKVPHSHSYSIRRTKKTVATVADITLLAMFHLNKPYPEVYSDTVPEIAQLHAVYWERKNFR